jgi:aspartyl-tRNA(Asn)/glutamyl-tRNA(Gln) amidotransferase subunit A
MQGRDLTAPLWSLSATRLGEGFARGAFTPSDALEAVLARIAALNPGLNAVVTLDAEGARRDAAASTGRWRAGRAAGALDGVPITVKDNIPVAGLRASWGSLLLADYVPVRDELPVARLRASGAVILGKTNCPEFSLQGYTDNKLFGPTRNPWNPALTPGGSSGGAAAGVAAGFGPIAIGTDGGGSIRRPACHTGLVGFKPTAKHVARADGFPPILLDFEVIGPLTRTVADARLVMDVIGPVPILPPSPRRIRFVPHFGSAPVDPEVAASVAAAATALRQLGHSVEEGEVPFACAPLDAAWPVIGQTGLAWLLQSYEGWEGLATDAVAAMAAAGGALPATAYFGALQVVRALQSELSGFFRDYDLILTPSAAALPWLATQSHPEEIDGQPVGPRGHAVFTAFANLAGCPGINLPCAPSAAGLPIGFQLVGAQGADATVLAVAEQYEAAHPWRDLWAAGTAA